jgi:hypothetical protein
MKEEFQVQNTVDDGRNHLVGRLEKIMQKQLKEM